jgi:hypothetical protein
MIHMSASQYNQWFQLHLRLPDPLFALNTILVLSIRVRVARYTYSFRFRRFDNARLADVPLMSSPLAAFDLATCHLGPTFFPSFEIEFFSFFPLGKHIA